MGHKATLANVFLFEKGAVIKLALVMVLALACFCLAPAYAENEDVFVVPRVPVQAQAESASEAKRIAQSRGRRRAMDILLRRLTVEDDWVYLPNLRRGEPAAAVMTGTEGKSPIVIDAQQLLSLESGFVVYGEKSSARTYRAYITYRFKPEEVRRLLRYARIPYSEAQTRTALVLPVLQTDKAIYLWEKNNPWMGAWKARPYTHELTPMTAPLGDLEDVALITAKQALAFDQEKLQALAQNYSVPQVIIAHARLRQEEGVDQISIRLMNGYLESSAVEASNELDAILNSEDGLEGDGVAPLAGDNFVAPSSPRQALTAIGGAKPGDVLGDAYFTEPSGNFPMLAERAIEHSIASYAKAWKARTLIDYASEAFLQGTAFFQSIQEWAQIRAALIETPLVGSVQVSALSRDGAEMRLRVFGDPSRLAAALEGKGLVFWSEGDERWFVATPATATLYRGQRSLRRRRGMFGENDFTGDGNGQARPVPVSLPSEGFEGPQRQPGSAYNGAPQPLTGYGQKISQ